MFNIWLCLHDTQFLVSYKEPAGPMGSRHTVSIMWVTHHQLFASTSRTLESSQWPSHQLHFHLHGVQRSEHLLHSLGIFQSCISLQEVLHVQLNLLFLFWGCSFCAGSSSGPGWVSPRFLASLSDGQWLDHCGWWTLKASHIDSERNHKDGSLLFWLKKLYAFYSAPYFLWGELRVLWKYQQVFRFLPNDRLLRKCMTCKLMIKDEAALSGFIAVRGRVNFWARKKK